MDASFLSGFLPFNFIQFNASPASKWTRHQPHRACGAPAAADNHHVLHSNSTFLNFNHIDSSPIFHQVKTPPISPQHSQHNDSAPKAPVLSAPATHAAAASSSVCVQPKRRGACSARSTSAPAPTWMSRSSDGRGGTGGKGQSPRPQQSPLPLHQRLLTV